MQAETNGKKAISKNARLLARAVGAQAPVWVELLSKIPPRSEQLLLSMLLPLTGDRSLDDPLPNFIQLRGLEVHSELLQHHCTHCMPLMHYSSPWLQSSTSESVNLG